MFKKGSLMVKQEIKTYSFGLLLSLENKIAYDAKKLNMYVKSVSLSSGLLKHSTYHYAVVIFERIEDGTDN